LEKVQRESREFARIDCFLPAICHLDSGENLVGVCRDISGGGAQAAFPNQLEPDSEVGLTLTLKEEHQIRLSARVLDCWRDEAAAKHLQHRCRVEFLDVSDVVRRELVRFVFDRMAEVLRRESG